MNIFIDRHHEGLTESIYRLFEGRLGHKVFIPIGMEWFEKGYWALNNQEDTARQFLEENYIPDDGTPPLNNNIRHGTIKRERYRQRAITFSQFLNMEIDLVIASIPSHIGPFSDLARIKSAKFAIQLGNEWPDNLFYGYNVLASIKTRDFPLGTNAVFYHQEFEESLFEANSYRYKPAIYSFVNVLKEKPQDYELFLALEKALPMFRFKMYGAQNRDGNIDSLEDIALRMQSCAYMFHCKTGGDGFGHILWNGAFAGAPLVTRLLDYKGKLGEVLMNEKTSIFVDGKSVDQVAKEIREKYLDGSYRDMSRRISSLARANCDFNKDAMKVKLWLENLI